jgi:hypothetical protein
VPTILIDSDRLVHDRGDKFSVTTLCSNGIREREITKKEEKKKKEKGRSVYVETN